MPDDPIVAEVRQVREAHAASFGFDLDAIFADLKEQERKSGRTFVTCAPHRVQAPEAAGREAEGNPTRP